MKVVIDPNNKQFQDAMKLIQFTSQSVFLTGKAGTGKSTFLKHICSQTKKKHIVLAPTGIAAINAGGVTLHSFFKMPFHPLLPNSADLSLTNNRIHEFLKYDSSKRKLIQEVELVIIDEISMVRADMIDFVDRVLRVYSHNMRDPFGGKQLLFVGDVYQLEPVITSDTREILAHCYPNPFFFSARVFTQMELVSIELHTVYRQTDPTFISILDHIRNNTAGDQEFQKLNQRHSPTPLVDEMHITLATRRDTVDYINEQKLRELPGEAILFKGIIKNEFPEKCLPTPKELLLKKDAQVIFIKNDPERRFVNGTIGVVSSFDEEGRIYILKDDGSECMIEQDLWRNIRYNYNEQERKIEEEVLGTYAQYPIRLAWAITIHKSQGLTFSNVVIDFTGGVFAGGQAYVALSRCTSLEGIQLTKPINRSDVFVRKEVVSFATTFNDKQVIEKALKQSQADVQYVDAIKAFDAGDFQASLDHFFIAIHARYDIEKPLIKRYLRKKLHIINTLKEKNEQLQTQLADQQQDLQKYATEYYLMGNACITEAGDSKAAIANYNKAIALNPKMVDAWVRKGITLVGLHDYFEASICFNEGVNINPHLFKTRYHRGATKLKLDDYQEAISDLLIATDLKPGHINTHTLLGNVYHQIGLPDMAKMHWQIAETLRENAKEK